jgi:uncharacterized protein
MRILKPAWLILAVTALVSGADFGALRPTGYVNDFAGVIRDPGIRRELEDYCRRVEDSTGAQIALVTLPSLEGEPIEDVANLLYRKWGIGDKRNNEGVLVLLAIADRRSRVEVGYGLEPYLPDGFAGSVLRGMRPALRQGDYGAAMAEAARQVAERVAAAKGVQIGQRAPRRAGPRPAEPVPWPLLMVGLVIVMFLLSSVGRAGARAQRGGTADLLTGMLIGHLLGRGMGGHRSGGGFGGYDSFDGFGGFGGGSSGGGGASSSW